MQAPPQLHLLFAAFVVAAIVLLAEVLRSTDSRRSVELNELHESLGGVIGSVDDLYHAVQDQKKSIDRIKSSLEVNSFYDMDWSSAMDSARVLGDGRARPHAYKKSSKSKSSSKGGGETPSQPQCVQCCPDPMPPPPTEPPRCELEKCQLADRCLTTFEEVLNATRNATYGDVIALCSGVEINVTEQLVLAADNITVCCQGSESCTLRRGGSDRHRVLNVEGDSSTLCGVDIHDGYPADGRDGGNVRIIGGGDHLIVNCIIGGGRASGAAGGNIYVKRAGGSHRNTGITIRDCSVLSGHSRLGAGAYISNVMHARMENTDFENNGASGATHSGGGLFVKSVEEVAIVSCGFVSNSATFGAGFDADSTGSFSVNSSVFTSNVASRFGGAGFLSTGTYVLDGNTGANNTGGGCTGFWDGIDDTCLALDATHVKSS